MPSKRFYCSILFVLCVLVFIPTLLVNAEQNSEEAHKLNIQITNSQGTAQNSLQDGSTFSGVNFYEADTLKIVSDTAAQGIYILWQRYPLNGYTLEQNDTLQTLNNGFFQEYIPINLQANDEIVLKFNSTAKPVEISLYGDGTLPESVHYWQSAVEKADILLLPPHADDEHLFFGGVMPTYLNMDNISVQVAYMVNHSTEPYRQQELLNALWEAGLRNYPVIGPFPDQYSDSLAHAKIIYDEQAVADYIADLYERFVPQVVVGHDFAGEYGHGAHMLFAEAMIKATQQTQAQPQKIYVHLYAENEIIMDVDTPLENYGGRTAFEVAQDAFNHHNSQLTYFTVRKDGSYDLRKFGLAFNLVPVDTGNDMLENITTYYTQEQIALEEQAKAEAEAAALAEKQAAEKAAAEAAAEAERQAIAEAEREIIEHAEQMQNMYIILGDSLVALIVITFFIIRGKKTKH